MTDDRYILDKDKNVVVADLGTWAEWFEHSKEERIVKREAIGTVTVSTVFLGLDHQWGDGPPLLFETLVFGGVMDGEIDRCSTWVEAEKMHKRMVDKIIPLVGTEQYDNHEINDYLEKKNNT